MKKRTVFRNIFFVFTALILFSCSDNTVPSPEMEKLTESASGNRAVLLPPQNLVVSQGGKREINLTWSEVSKASRYYVYAADSLFSEYELVGESTKTDFTYSPLGAGITKYLRICSVDYAGNVSSKTEPVVGTTLAQPIISDITPVSGKEDSSLAVYWYMENADFYKDALEYTITCKDSDGKEIANSNVYASELDSTSFVLDDLKPSESYVYTVTAFLSSNPAASEASLEVDAETARRLRPNPPEELSATQGTETASITVSFKLPSEVDVLVAAKTYVQYPLYFKIYRRLSGSEDWGNAIVNHLYFDGSTEKSENLDFEKYEEKRTTEDYFVTWTDENVGRGVKYEYKVQSYADNTTRIITSDLSSGETCGWAAAVPTFETSINLTKNDDESAYKSAELSVDFDWETFGKGSDWKFILKTQTSQKLEDMDSAEPTYDLLESIDSVKSFTKNYDLSSEENEGYFKYALIIVKASDVVENSAEKLAEAAEKSFIEIPAATIFFLTSVISQPNLENFALADGYADKTELSWTYETDCTYSLERQTLNSDGTVVADSKIEITNFEPPEGEDFSYKDENSVESGKIYSYTLYATKEGRIFPSKALTAKTLGVPAVTFVKNELAYDSITVSWAQVQKAKSYEVSLFNGETQLGETDTLDSEKISEISSAGEITYKLSNPTGYDDATISGKSLTLKVTAKSTVNSENSGETFVRTMGPADIGLKASEAAYSDKISVEWNEIDGAKGYILQRTRYDIPESGESTAQKTDLFYVAADKTITYGETEISDSVLNLSSEDGAFKLLDKQLELNSTTGYETSQALISSGVLFEYTVLPVLESDDSSEVVAFKIKYGNIEKISSKGSTHGFGHNVTASKAEYTNKIDISWNKPANPSGLKPTLYKRKIAASDSDSDSSEWKDVGKVFSEEETSYTDTLSVSEANIYEYAVKYGEAKANFSKAYLNLLASRKNSLNEQENRGYAFNVYYAAANGNEAEFSETFRWTPFDSTKRKSARVSGYSIYLKNTNYPHGWQKIAILDSAGTRTEGFTSSDDFGNSGDFNVNYDYSEKIPNQLTIKPVTATAKFGDVTGGGSYEGLLKVLRDPRHYYKIVMEGERTSDGSTYENITFDPSSEDIDDDMSIYACRQITDAELARAAMLTLTYAFYIHDGGKSDYSNVGEQFKYPGVGNTISSTNGGSVIFRKKEAWSEGISTWGKGKSSYYPSGNYAPSQLTPSENTASFVGISAGNSFSGTFRLRTSDDVDPYLYAFADEDTIVIEKADSSIPVDYSGEIKFTCQNSNHANSAANCLTLSVTRNGKTTQLCSTTSDNSLRKYYFPMQIWNNQSYVLHESYYGWWEER